MANALYKLWKENLVQGSANYSLTNTVKAVLVNSTYVFSQAHQFWSSAVANIEGAAVTLTTKTYTLGVFDADDPVFTGVTNLHNVNACIIYIDIGGVAANSPLVAYIDTATGLPLTANGANINGVWDNGANKIFAV